MTFSIYTLFQQTGWIRKPATAGVFTLFLLLGSNLMAATTDRLPPNAGIPNVAPDLGTPESAADLALANVATAKMPEKEDGNTVIANGSVKAPAGQHTTLDPSSTSSIEKGSMTKELVADRIVEDSVATVTSRSDQTATTDALETGTGVKEIIADKAVAEKRETGSNRTDKSPVTQPIETEPTETGADIVVTEKLAIDLTETDQPAEAEPVDSKSTTKTPTFRTPAIANASDAAEALNKIATQPNETVPQGTPENTPLPVAEDVDLSQPVIIEREPALNAVPVTTETNDSEAQLPASQDDVKPPLVLLGEEVAPGTSARLSWSPNQNFDGISVPTPVLVVNGKNPGKTLCLTAAIHGDELNGIEIVRRVMYGLDAKELNGAVIGVPIVNLQGFRRNSRYLPDRRDLNRFFPGNAGGSSASRLAHSFFTQVISVCDALVDIHTGSFLRTNLPQLRADMSVPEVAELTEGFGATAVLHSSSTGGTLRRAAVVAGIPAVTLETGEPSRLQEEEIEHGTKGIQTLLTKLKMTRRVRVWGEPEPVYYKSVWVRADDGGLLFTSVKLGQRVRKGQVLGTVTDPITNVRSELVSPRKGRVLGMALNQVVLPGFATFRIGIPSKQKEVVVPSDTPLEITPEQPAPDIPQSVPADADIEDENS